MVGKKAYAMILGLLDNLRIFLIVKNWDFQNLKTLLQR